MGVRGERVPLQKEAEVLSVNVQFSFCVKMMFVCLHRYVSVL